MRKRRCIAYQRAVAATSETQNVGTAALIWTSARARVGAPVMGNPLVADCYYFANSASLRKRTVGARCLSLVGQPAQRRCVRRYAAHCRSVLNPMNEEPAPTEKSQIAGLERRPSIPATTRPACAVGAAARSTTASN